MTAFGMVIGMLLTRFCTGSHLMAWLWFVALTVLHVWANLRAMRCLVLTSINQPRLETLLKAYTANVSKPLYCNIYRQIRLSLSHPTPTQSERVKVGHQGPVVCSYRPKQYIVSLFPAGQGVDAH